MLGFKWIVSGEIHKNFSKKILFLGRGEGREKERERNNVLLPLVCPALGTWPATQACALTRNRTGDPWIPRPLLNPQNHTSQGSLHFLNKLHSIVMYCSFSVLLNFTHYFCIFIYYHCSLLAVLWSFQV